MKKEDIPQDESSLAQKQMKELCYAVGEDGKYSTGLSTGWEAKTIALDLTMEEILQRAEIAKKEVYQGEKSPIYYFMIISKMDLPILAGYMGMAKWRIKRHFKPNVFKNLKESVLKQYADVFDMDIQKLTNFNE
ncbi:MAG: hypothetical protein H3C31_08340 [Brumimicrobium sp.]|nr:hypothetical protein [Brumimicrobium sp.]